MSATLYNGEPTKRAAALADKKGRAERRLKRKQDAELRRAGITEADPLREAARAFIFGSDGPEPKGVLRG